MRRILLLILLGTVPLSLGAQWTVKPGGWFMSHGLNKGRFPDRFSADQGATENALEKVDWGLYFIYGWKEGLSLGLGQGFANLEDKRNGTSTTTTGFGATGLFVMKRLAQGKAGILSVQPRVDLPLLYDTGARPVLGPVKAEAELRLLYGTGYGLAGQRGWISTAVGGSAWRHGDDELRYDGTIGLNTGSQFTVMAQTFNVIGFKSGGGIDYSATKVGGSLIVHVSKSVGLVGGFYGGVSGRNTARERTASLSIWINHDPRAGAPPQTPH